MFQVAICDDIKCEREFMKKRLKHYSEQKNVSFNIQEFSSGEELLKIFKRQFDLIILDVEMGGMNGIETAKQIRKRDRAVSLFFSTKHSQYAYNSFSVNPSGYLMKTEEDSQYMFQLSNAIRSLDKRKQKIFIEYQGEKIWIEMADILFLESFDHCVLFHMIDGSIYKTKKSLYRILEETTDSYLTMINRNEAINVIWIESYLDGNITLRTLKRTYEVARRRKRELEEKYISYCKESI